MSVKLVGLLLLAVLLGTAVAAPVPKADPVPPVAPEHLKASTKNLKLIGLAIHNYANNFADALPGNVLSKDGKPLLSWRVALLPYLDEQKLYEQFKLDEPWDSDNNKKLIEKMPKVYAPVRVRANLGVTYYQQFVGKSALFTEKGPAYKLSGIPDGTSQTVFVVEAGDPVIWTKPADLPFDEAKALPKLGGLFDGDFHLLLGDGSVMLCKKTCDAGELKNTIMPAEGIPVDFKKLQK